MENWKEIHKPVMLEEVLNNLIIRDNGTYVDATFGLGGHSRAILKKIKDGELIAFELDKEEIELSSQDNFFFRSNFLLINENFNKLTENLNRLKKKEVDGFLFDLGLCSYQLNCLQRGFSFRNNSSLNMRIDHSNKEKTAEFVLNNYSAKDLTSIFRTYGEEKNSAIIARRIVERRKTSPIETTQQLVGIVASCFEKKSNKHPARKIFQALRIYLNNELENLTSALEQTFNFLSIGGRILVISYNSLEDRIVKRIFKEKSLTSSFRIINKKVIKPSLEEIKENNRSRSARMRIIEKI